ncbi:MAG: hypothetical protein V3R72_10085, partial [Gammaproteobacteria bacterium]
MVCCLHDALQAVIGGSAGVNPSRIKWLEANATCQRLLGVPVLACILPDSAETSARSNPRTKRASAHLLIRRLPQRPHPVTLRRQLVQRL